MPGALLVPVPVLTEPVFTGPLLPPSVLLVLTLVPGELLLAGVLAPPSLTGGLDRGEDGVEGGELAAPGGDVPTAGLLVWDCAGVADEHGFALAWLSLWPPVALVFALAEAVEPAGVLVGVAVALADDVAVLVAVVLLSLGLTVPPAESLAGLVVPLTGELGTDPPGEAFGLAGLPDWDGLTAAIDDGLGVHEVTVPLTPPAEVPPRPTAPPPVLNRVPVPAAFPPPPLLLLGEEEIPTAEASWPMASRSGGTARAMPMANTAQATARAGRNSPYFHFHGCGRLSPGSPAPPRTAFQRRTRSARKPPDAPACACLLA